MYKALEEEIRCYEMLKSALLPEHAGEYILIHGGLLIGTYDDPIAAEEEAARFRFQENEYLIEKISDEYSTDLLWRDGVDGLFGISHYIESPMIH